MDWTLWHTNTDRFGTFSKWSVYDEVGMCWWCDIKTSMLLVGDDDQAKCKRKMLENVIYHKSLIRKVP